MNLERRGVDIARKTVVICVGVILAGCTWAQSTDETEKQAREWRELPVFELQIPNTRVVGPTTNIGSVDGDWAQSGYVRITWEPTKGQTIDLNPIFESLIESGFKRYKCRQSAAGSTDFYFLRETGQLDQGSPDFDEADVLVPPDERFVRVEVSHWGTASVGPSNEPFTTCERDS